MFIELQEDYHTFGIAREQYEQLIDLHKKLDDYIPPKTDQEVLDDPKWSELVGIAKKVYNTLLPILSSNV